MNERQLQIRESYTVRLNEREQQIKAMLPPSIPWHRFKETAMVAVMSNPAIWNKDQASVIRAIYDCANLQVLPDGKRAALVAYKGQVKAQIMVRGVVELLHRSGKVKNLVVEIVYEDEAFEYCIDANTDTGVRLRHEPHLYKEKKYNQVTHVYAILKTLDGATYTAVMDKKEIDAAKAKSAAGEKGPWNSPDWREMVKKTVLHRLSKRVDLLPLEKAAANLEQTVELPAIEGEAAPQVESKGVAKLVENNADKN